MTREPDCLRDMRVLVADNSMPDLARFVRKLIDRFGGGGHVELALSMEEALAHLESAEFDVVIVEWWLAWQDDIRLVRKLAADSSNPIPFVLTGSHLPRASVARPPLNRAVFALERIFELPELVDILAACRPTWRSA